MLMERIREVAVRLRNGSLTVEELYKQCMQRAKSLQQLNAFLTLTPALAKKQAEESGERITQGKAKSVLDGIPVAAKDNFSTACMETTCASHMLAGYVPPYTATVVQGLLDEGAVLMGKTNMDEFAMGTGSVDSVHGPVQNVWRHPLLSSESSHPAVVRQEGSEVRLDSVDSENDGWFVAGGSSGGSAVAVASGMCFAALGSDTGGSVRLPASHCGVVGFKPTYGLCSRHGLIPLTNSLDVPGIFTKSVDDVAFVLGAMAGHDPLDSTTVMNPFQSFELPENISVEGLRVGIPQEFHPPSMEADAIQAWSKAADIFENAGAVVSKVSLPHIQLSLLCYSVLGPVEIASNMARYDGIEYGHRANGYQSTEELYAATRHEGFNDIVRGRILAGNYFLLKDNYEKYFLQAQKVRRLVVEDFCKSFESGIDVFLTPAAVGSAKSYQEFVMFDSRKRQEIEDCLLLAVNLAGIPAVTVPAALSSQSMPIGIQLIGPSFKEKELLTVAKWYEQQVEFPRAELEASLRVLDG
ncbi:glutamyl-tRNA(Gln) amidotransferase subunit A, mitochondrial-like [Acanthaster planci]|uniref:Glutamyl-tRNA(Gln) amidotransferase subunit A, mitochondrial n=1 Tax=Acanthaster planci TaxID=133434 RepID=A0A8B7XMV4_ACAPL|nr:glutamyl-tRNA(Gln) amidotransferase subunit A, mitochondrial-like [Acanthaster planci]